MSPPKLTRFELQIMDVLWNSGPASVREIQEALAGKGFLQPGEVTGQWGPASVDALKRFQSAQNIESNGKINSLSLIALGLGPKRDNTAAAKPPAAQ